MELAEKKKKEEEEEEESETLYSVGGYTPSIFSPLPPPSKPTKGDYGDREGRGDRTRGSEARFFSRGIVRGHVGGQLYEEEGAIWYGRGETAIAVV